MVLPNLAIGAQHGRLVVMCLESGETLLDVKSTHSATSIAACAFSPDGTWLATAGGDRSWARWDFHQDSERPRLHVKGHDGKGRCICTTRSSVEKDCPVQGHTGPLMTIAACTDKVATGGNDGIVCVWCAETGALKYRLEHTHVVAAASFSPNGRFLGSSDASGKWKVSDAASGNPIREGKLRAAVKSLRFLGTDVDKGQRLSMIIPEGLWSFDTGDQTEHPEEQRRLSPHVSQFSEMAPTIVLGSSVAYVTVSKIVVASTVLQHLCRYILIPGDGMSSLAPSPNGRHFASGSSDGTCKVWDSDGCLLRNFDMGPSRVTSVAMGKNFDRESKLLAFVMGTHSRLGAAPECRINTLGGCDFTDVLHMIGKMVKGA
jgi:WD40 repeat protein